MPIERVEDIQGELVVGKHYLVRAVYFSRNGYEAAQWFPIIGPKHEDKEDFNFDRQHYHLDPRFLTKRMLASFSSWWEEERLNVALKTPLQEHGALILPKPVRRRMQCRRAAIEYPFDSAKTIVALNSKYAGRQAKRAKTGWLCPHRRALLNGFPPDSEGVITCPLHGLRIDNATGKCIGPKDMAARA